MHMWTGSPGAGKPAVAPLRGQRPQAHHRSPRFAPLWLLSPAGLVIAALVIAPIFFLVFTSFTDFNSRTLFVGTFNFVGFGQYIATFQSAQFWWSTLITVLFTAALVAGSVVIGVGVAQLLTRLGRVLRFSVTIVLILAWAMPNVASSQVWKFLFQPGLGVINWLLTTTGLFGNVTNLAWDNHTFLGLLCIWLLVVWQAVPFIALTTYAAQTQLDPAYLEAARLDGASEARIYTTIVLNYLRPTILLVTVLSIIWDFNIFNQIWLITQGGPNNSTATLGIWTYLTAFNTFKIGTGAAISVITTIMLLIISGFYIRNLLRSGEDL